MSDMNQGSGVGIVVAAVVGAAVGAGIALLFAPCSGRETRAWFSRRTGEIKDRTTSAVEHGIDAARRAAKEIGRSADEVANTRDRPMHTEAGDTRIRG